MKTETLYDQSDLLYSNLGGNSQDYSQVDNALDEQSADDFVIPAGERWQISAVSAKGYYGFGNPPPGGPTPALSLWFFADDGGFPGDELCSYSNLQAGEDFSDSSGDLTITLPDICALDGGPHWLSIQVIMDDSRGNWFWRLRRVRSNNGYVYQNPGNGWGTGCTSWTRATLCGAPDPSDLGFSISGNRIVAPGACRDGSFADTDNDGLLDCWETEGIDFDGDGNVDLELYDVDQDGVVEGHERAHPDRKDIYLEIDWMAQHQPSLAALLMVTNSFSREGIRLRIQADERAVAHHERLIFSPVCTTMSPDAPRFSDIKVDRFGTVAERNAANSTNILGAKRLAFHYGLFAHRLQGRGSTTGCADGPGDDFVISLGGWSSPLFHTRPTPDKEAGILMHELGHNLNLKHGGGDHFNCKPNYLSVMNYTRVFNDTPIRGRPLDYSRQALPTLDESDLDEPAGVGGPDDETIVYGPTPRRLISASEAIDWNRDGDEFDLSVTSNVNKLVSGGCLGDGSILSGYDDWGNLRLDLFNAAGSEDGPQLNKQVIPEITFDQAMALSGDGDGDGIKDLIDNCLLIANTGQDDVNADGIGDACARSEVRISGLAEGGLIDFLVDGVVIRVNTTAGTDAEHVAAQIAAAINGERELAEAGVKAASADRLITCTADLTVLAITDPGIAEGASEGCSDGDRTMCLNNERFKVEVTWADLHANTGSAHVVEFGSADSGLFWFFNADNWEMLVKVLNGCGLNSRFWVFAAATTDVEYTLKVTDTETGTTKTYFNPLGNAAAAITDTDAFASCPVSSTSDGATKDDGNEGPRSDGFLPSQSGEKAVCQDSNTSLCLLAERFSVEVNWHDFTGTAGAGTVVPFRSADSGLFWFFDSDNWEMLVKVLDGCGLNDRFWVFAAATTDVGYTLTVTDTFTGAVQEYTNPLGNAAAALTDTSAFATCDATPQTAELTVSRAGSGSGRVISDVAGIDCPSRCSETYPLGTKVHLIPVPGSSSLSTGWGGDADCSDGIVILDSDRSCTAEFSVAPPQTRELAVTKYGSGTGRVTTVPAGIDCSYDCNERYPKGTEIELIGVADPGSAFSGWGGELDCLDGVVVLDASRFCFGAFIRDQ